jgi:integrase
VTKRFDRVLRRLNRTLGLREIRFHDLRHTHATLLLEDGLDAKYVSERLGHDSVQTTLELYGHVTSRRRWHAAARIGDMLDGPAARICDPVVTPVGSDGSQQTDEAGI